MRSIRLSSMPRRSDAGAAAVEFALLLPIFVLLVFGGISVGMIYWHSISATQAARDAARYGATLEMSSTATVGDLDPTLTTGEWLDAVTSVALHEAGIGDTTGDGDVTIADAQAANVYVCTAFVRGNASTPINTVSLSSSSFPASTDPCILTDGAPATADRVQVLVKRDERLNAVFFSRQLTTETRSVQPYQRTIK
jgi:Flp pilus assembly protein TadG